eukprot:scaffold3911_cov60-Phaeocystis_antarctica.AAC.4
MRGSHYAIHVRGYAVLPVVDIRSRASLPSKDVGELSAAHTDTDCVHPQIAHSPHHRAVDSYHFSTYPLAYYPLTSRAALEAQPLAVTLVLKHGL